MNSSPHAYLVSPLSTVCLPSLLSCGFKRRDVAVLEPLPHIRETLDSIQHYQSLKQNETTRRFENLLVFSN